MFLDLGRADRFIPRSNLSDQLVKIFISSTTSGSGNAVPDFNSNGRRLRLARRSASCCLRSGAPRRTSRDTDNLPSLLAVCLDHNPEHARVRAYFPNSSIWNQKSDEWPMKLPEPPLDWRGSPRNWRHHAGDWTAILWLAPTDKFRREAPHPRRRYLVIGAVFRGDELSCDRRAISQTYKKTSGGKCEEAEAYYSRAATAPGRNTGVLAA